MRGVTEAMLAHLAKGRSPACDGHMRQNSIVNWFVGLCAALGFEGCLALAAALLHHGGGP